ncbi:MAG: GNAT family N-acetyltransferase [Pseudomonadota bacterium]
MNDIQLHSQAPSAAATELHDQLAAAGQTLTDDQMPSFLLSVPAADGTLRAGLKGEIAFQTARVAELWVSPDLRGQGIGTSLVARADDHARGAGCTRIQIETQNPAAQRLYAAQGYTVFGALPDYDGPNSLVYMVKDL